MTGDVPCLKTYKNIIKERLSSTRGYVVQKIINQLSPLVFPQRILGNDRNSDYKYTILALETQYFSGSLLHLSNSYFEKYIFKNKKKQKQKKSKTNKQTRQNKKEKKKEEGKKKVRG